jgi:hypothetical protein
MSYGKRWPGEIPGCPSAPLGTSKGSSTTVRSFLPFWSNHVEHIAAYMYHCWVGNNLLYKYIYIYIYHNMYIHICTHIYIYIHTYIWVYGNVCGILYCTWYARCIVILYTVYGIWHMHIVILSNILEANGYFVIRSGDTYCVCWSNGWFNGYPLVN